jgi:hypothetical protein
MLNFPLNAGPLNTDNAGYITGFNGTTSESVGSGLYRLPMKTEGGEVLTTLEHGQYMPDLKRSLDSPEFLVSKVPLEWNTPPDLFESHTQDIIDGVPALVDDSDSVEEVAEVAEWREYPGVLSSSALSSSKISLLETATNVISD